LTPSFSYIMINKDRKLLGLIRCQRRTLVICPLLSTEYSTEGRLISNSIARSLSDMPTLLPANITNYFPLPT
jgi:hypothetical protein